MPDFTILAKEYIFITHVIAPGAITTPPIGLLTVAIETGIGGWKAYQAAYTGMNAPHMISPEFWQTVAAYGNKIKDPQLASAYFPQFDISKYNDGE